ncbi:hypothetical protein [Burkholderia gladioli]|uniref:hypothetical protein n=1 Tax=Burkholderia gladioli TaxID=28095 RepID=UPI001640FBF5|nr:hypothetical protein [Burkholderia gladioli]
MALQMPLTFADGTVVSAAYLNAYLEGPASGMTVRMQVWPSKDLAGATPPKQIMSFPGFVPNVAPGQPDLFTQAYAWMKTKPGFTNAVDA